MRFADEFSSAVFLAAQCALPFDETCNLISSKSTSQTPASSQPSADLLALVSIIALLGCRRKDSTDIVDFLRKNMGKRLLKSSAMAPIISNSQPSSKENVLYIVA